MTPTEARDHAVDFLTWSLRLLILLAAIVTIWVIVNAVAGAADIECRASQGEGSNWAWRYVKPHDNQRCWYRGHGGVPKSQLHWPGGKPKMIDPVFPKQKTVKSDEFNELDAQADKDAFFDAKPITNWPPIMHVTPFIPWEERISGAL